MLLSVTYRLVFFFVIGALSVGIVCPYNDPGLLRAGGPTAARSPYVISMVRLGITALPVRGPSRAHGGKLILAVEHRQRPHHDLHLLCW